MAGQQVSEKIIPAAIDLAASKIAEKITSLKMSDEEPPQQEELEEEQEIIIPPDQRKKIIEKKDTPAPFFDSVLKINGNLIEHCEDLDVVNLMYCLLYSKTFRKTTGRFWNY